jgi:hypothetical protein
MKISLNDVVDLFVDELKESKNKITLAFILFEIKNNPIIKSYLNDFPIGDIAKLVYTVFFKLKGWDDNKIKKYINDVVIYSFVEFHHSYEKYKSCYACNGDGTVRCNSCSGIGTTECDDCGGDGKIETSDDVEECSTCQGSGMEECSSCYGDGNEECLECMGSGDSYETMEMEYVVNVVSNILPLNVVYDMENADYMVDDFDDQIQNSQSQYQLVLFLSEYNSLEESDAYYDSRNENQSLFLNTINPNLSFKSVKEHNNSL